MGTFLKWLWGAGDADLAGGQLRLTFLADYDGNVVLALLAAMAALAVLTVRTYRREGAAPPGAKTLLASLRLGVVALGFVVLFRPAVALRTEKVLHSSVVLLLDDSLSMSFVDRYGSDGQYRARLAQSLGVAEEQLVRMTRQDILRAALSGGGGAIAKLAKDHPVLFIRYSTNQPGRDPYVRQLGQIDIASQPQAAADAAPVAEQLSRILGHLTAAGYETNIPKAVREAIETIQGQRVAALIVLGDGQNTAPDGLGRLASARDYADERNVPLYTVVVGDPSPPKNVAVTALRGPRETRRGARVEFTADIAHDNVEADSFAIRLQRRRFDAAPDDWSDVAATAEVSLEGPADGSGQTSAVLAVEPDETGEFVYRAVIDPRPYEQNLADNVAEAPLTVADAKINILLISGDSGWEFQYLRNVLLRSPDRYRVSVWQQNAEHDVSQIASTEQMKLSRLPRELDELMGVKGDASKPGYDLVILYDPQPVPGSFDRHFVQDMLEPFVDRGRGLCYIAGNKYSELVMSDKASFQALADVLPVTLAPNPVNYMERIGYATSEPWPVVLTSYGKDHPVTRLTSSAEDSSELWKRVPGIFWSHPVRGTKPAAHVLMENSNPTRRTGRNDPEPLLVAQTYSKGRVLYVGFDDSWRWRMLADGHYHRRFWHNVMQYLSTSRSKQVVVRCGGDRFSAGQQITVEVEAYDEKHQPLTAGTFEVEMVNLQTGQSSSLTLHAVEGRPGQFKVAITAKQIGPFELTAWRHDPRAAEKVASKRILVELPQDEALRRQADEGVMRGLAAKPEYFLRAADLDKLAEIVPLAKRYPVDERYRELWDRPAVLIVIAMLLAGEWIVRKKYNMA